MTAPSASEGHSSSATGWLGVVLELVFAAGLALALSAFAMDRLDAIPRPLALLFLFGAPAVVAALGMMGRRRAVVAGAGAALLLGAPLSFTGVTVIFLIPALLLIVAAARLGASPGPRTTELVEATVIAALLVGAGIALFGLTAETCSTDLAGGTECGTGLLTIAGVAVEVALQVTAVVIAAWRSGLAARLGGGAAS